MKAVILAGGTGTRLMPLTSLMNKHMLPVGKHPMIYYGISSLKKAGIVDILLVTGRHALGMFAQYLGSGSSFGVSITYRIQEEAGGIADALQLARPFIAEGEKFVVLLGDNLFEEELRPYVESYALQPGGAMVLLKQVDDPERYGIPVFHSSGRIERIDEKPKDPQSDLCVTGIYMYDSHVFKLIEQITPSGRGELEITDLNNIYAKAGLLTYRKLTGWWTDAGTFESLQEAASQLSGKYE
ncbi:sugar phosphate nucleotidyltransferase [Paenibacillus gorillae]|uniref:sugar phosphate nucleotidyltransferase n=1 Tax=Paenibacillus gorillae TaxID=1243662 RepID=UPI0004B278BE|nr:sugar phosphate nucleotidyltransferase [Paenibacillus gorillae]